MNNNSPIFTVSDEDQNPPLFTVFDEGQNPPSGFILNCDDSEQPSIPNSQIPYTAMSMGVPNSFSNYSGNPVFMDALSEKVAEKTAQIAFEPIIDGNRKSRRASIEHISGNTCLVYTQENGQRICIDIFEGYIENIETAIYKRQKFFRLIFVIDGQHKAGGYHAVSELTSVKKIGNILSECLNALDKRATDKSVLSNLQMNLNNLLSKNANSYKLIQLGWSFDKKTNYTYTRSLPEELLSNGNFTGNIFLPAKTTPAEHHNLIYNVINAYNQVGNKQTASVLLIFSFIATFYSLIKLVSPDTILVLLGNPNTGGKIASHFMKAYIRKNSNDVLSLSNDTKYGLRDYLSLLNDDVTIIIDDAVSKYNRDKLKDIYGYASSGQCKGDAIQTLFVICSDELGSLNYERQIFFQIQNETKIDFQNPIPQIFRRFIIEKVEEDSSYWHKRIETRYSTNQRETDCEPAFIVAAKTVCDILLEILNDKNTNEYSQTDFKRFLDIGISELKDQINKQESLDVISHFRTVVLNAVNDDTIKVWNRKIRLNSTAEKIVFYDDECYYFSAETFISICNANAIGKASQFTLKGTLAETGELHTYCHLKSRPDKGYDFYYLDENNKSIRTSGLAIYRRFWDAAVGCFSLVNLYELAHTK